MGKEINGVAQKPEWLTERVDGKSDGEKNLWIAAYDKISHENHYQKGEGPHQALSRLKDKGVLPTVSIEDIPQKAHEHVKSELGPKGTLHRDYYTTRDRVLTVDEEIKEVTRMVESQKKDWQAHRLAPTVSQLDSALTPKVVRQLENAGLDADAHKLRDGIIDRLNKDKALTSADMERMRSCPVGAPYVATGAVTGRQMDKVIAEQKSLRDEIGSDPFYKDLKQSDPERYKQEWQLVLKVTDVGSLLRRHASEDPRHYDLKKIEAADALITSLQELQKTEKPKR